MSEIPVEVMVDILSRLPVKSLLRFRCLSKQFRSIIDDPDFINRHLRYHSFDQRLIVLNKKSSYASELFSVDFDAAGNASKLEHPFENWGVDYNLVGSCNGLLALSHRLGFSVGLWNISTRKHQNFPKFWTELPRDKVYPYNYFFDGFGYDVATDDYKWVWVIHVYRKSFTEVTVYSLKTNSWRRIEDAPPYLIYYVTDIGTLVSGALNWLVRVIDMAYQDRARRRVLSFDLKSEKFHEVSLPNVDVDVEDELDFEIVVLQGCLCLCYFYPEVVDIWMMKEYGAKESWAKVFSFMKATNQLVPFPFSFGNTPLTYSRRGHEVLFYQGMEKFFCCDMEKETVESVEINGWPMFVLRVASYVDSLVSPYVNIELSSSGEKN